MLNLIIEGGNPTQKHDKTFEKEPKLCYTTLVFLALLMKIGPIVHREVK
jgi:hypothetical protein